MATEADVDLYSDDINTEFNQDQASGENIDLYDDVLAAPAQGEEKDVKPFNGPGPSPSRQVHSSNAAGGSNNGKKFNFCVGNLTWWTTDKDVTEALASVGADDVIEVKFFENRANGQSKGFCIVTVASERSCRTAFDRLRSKELHGQTPVVQHNSKQAIAQFEAQSKTRPSAQPQQQQPPPPQQNRGPPQQQPPPGARMMQQPGRGAPPSAPPHGMRPAGVPPQPPPGAFVPGARGPPPPGSMPPGTLVRGAPPRGPPPPAPGTVPPPGVGPGGPPPPGVGPMFRNVPPGVQIPRGPMGFPPGVPPVAMHHGPPGVHPPHGAPAPHVNPNFFPPGAPHPHPQQPVFPPNATQLSEPEFEEIMNRNRTVCSSAIHRAVSDASAGEYASAIETLVTAISLIKQSKVANDDRCKILTTTLQDTLQGIEEKSFSASARDKYKDEHRRSADGGGDARSRSRGRRREYSPSAAAAGNNTAERGYRERSRDREYRRGEPGLREGSRADSRPRPAGGRDSEREGERRREYRDYPDRPRRRDSRERGSRDRDRDRYEEDRYRRDAREREPREHDRERH